MDICEHIHVFLGGGGLVCHLASFTKGPSVDQPTLVRSLEDHRILQMLRNHSYNRTKLHFDVEIDD